MAFSSAVCAPQQHRMQYRKQHREGESAPRNRRETTLQRMRSPQEVGSAQQLNKTSPGPPERGGFGIYMILTFRDTLSPKDIKIYYLSPSEP